MATINLASFESQNNPSASPYAANRMLFDWLSDDASRAELYRELHGRKPSVLEFQSEARVEPAPGKKATVFHTTAYLLTHRDDIEQALSDAQNFSNEPYAALGSGTFMLGLDSGRPHVDQRAFAIDAFATIAPPAIEGLIARAFKIAAVLPLKQTDFDLAGFAEQVALRFVGLLYGLLPADHPMLEIVMSKAFRALNYQILGRHFVSEPLTPQSATVAMGTMLTRVAELIDQYRSSELPEDLNEFLGELGGFTPLLQVMANMNSPLSGNERAVVALGSIAGIIGNIQSGVCIAINEFFQRKVDAQAAAAARHDPSGAEMQTWVLEALRLHPPAAFLPRLTRNPVTLPSGFKLPEGAIVVLAMGSATRQQGGVWRGDFVPGRAEDPLIFGGPGNLHECLGRQIALPLVTHIVQQVLMLPGLSRTNDLRTGALCGLKKLWGFKCESLPLCYERDRLLVQQPLNVIMRVKTPVSEHAEALKLIIKYGAPKIEQKLAEARHVHFSWFVFLENDTKLALFTTYDRSFDPYIEHFALQIGPLFDKLFEHLEDAPNLPVKDFPGEFVQTIHRYNVAPVGGYFFSAYQRHDVTAIKGAPVSAVIGHPPPGPGPGPRPPPSPPAVPAAPAARDKARASSPWATSSSSPAAPPPPPPPEGSPIHVEDAQIQRLIVLGYKTQCCRHLVLTVDAAKADDARRWLAAVAGLVDVARPPDMDARRDPGPYLSIGFTHRGLKKLGVASRYLSVFGEKANAFVEGAYHRAGRMLSDTGRSSFEHWEDSFKPDRADILIVLHADDLAALESKCAELKCIDGAAALSGWDVPFIAEHLNRTPDEREVHFGFKDGLSTVSIKRIHLRDPGPLESPAHEPGEFLLGHPNDAHNNQWLLAKAEPAIARFFKNGSFGTLRKLEQNVVAFNTFVKEAAKEFSHVPNAREYVLAKMNGRWKNGAVVTADSPHAAPSMAPNAPIDNSFDFSKDPAGIGCPFGSHIRRMNPRSDPVVPFRKRPIIRRGMPYGPRFDIDPQATEGRGLLGLFFCASIEDQFEHLVAEWGNRNPMGTANKGTAKDPLFGNHTPADGSVFDIPMNGQPAERMSNFMPFVTTKGTLYAFFPSVNTVRTIACDHTQSHVNPPYNPNCPMCNATDAPR